MDLGEFVELMGVALPVIGAIIHLYSEMILHKSKIRSLERRVKRWSSLLLSLSLWAKENGFVVDLAKLNDDNVD